MKKATITGWGKYLPPNVMTNKDLEKIVDTTDQWITKRTGIKKRRIVDDDTTTSDLAIKAAKQALDKTNLKAENLDLIIVSTVTPDMVFPATACIVQDKLGANKAAAFDLEAGCSGFVYGLSVGAQFIESGLYENILVIGAETLSKITDWEDRNTCVLFGDGAGAAVLQPTDKGGFLSFDLGSDGSGADALYLEAGGSLNPATLETVKNKMHYIRMEGNPVFKFAVKKMKTASKDVLKKADLKIDDIDLLIPHQANTRIIKSARRRLKLDKNQVYVNLPEVGNTSSASVAIALAEAKDKGKIKDGDKLLMVAFGAGLTWAATVLEWNENI
ncbi:MAG: ketoacyl-ACP synthase III [Halanaerobiales bacterium]|nr:ketoacyl-ACP synthase III [Halanaerobiales bacterium]